MSILTRPAQAADATLAPDLGALRGRIEALDWSAAGKAVDAEGWAILPGLLTPDEADAVTALYPREDVFRSKVVMAQHGFGRGQYKYFSYPLPASVEALRTGL
jgi:hypothetical protein